MPRKTRQRTDARLTAGDARFTSEAMRRWSRVVSQQLLAYAPPTEHTIAQAVERFRAEEMYKLRPRTRDWMERQLLAIERECGRKSIDDEFRGIALRWHASLPASVAMQRCYLLARVMKLSCYWGWRSREHDLRGLCQIRTRTRTRILSLPQRVELFAECRKPATARRRVALDCIHLIHITGWRPSEAASLERGWVVRDEVTGAWLPQTKTTDAPQFRVLAKEAIEFLDSLPNTGPHYFPHRSGKGHVNPKSVLGVFKEIAEAKGWPTDLVLMSCRHTFSTVGAQLSFSPSFVGALVGNSARSQARYVHPQPDDLREAADGINAALQQGRKRRG